MKLGDTKSDETMQLIAPASAWETGRWNYRHPRCGRVEFERREVIPGPPFPERAFHWVIIAIERPDTKD